jgi:hypothetical protein
MKTIASMIAALAVVAMAAPANASSDCTRVLSKQGAKAFFACLDQNRN